MSRLVVFTKLTPAECQARLAQAADTYHSAGGWLRAMFGRREVYGKATETALRLYQRPRYRRNCAVLSARLTPESGGTVLHASVGLQRVQIWVLAVWCAMSLAGTWIFLRTQHASPLDARELLFVSMPVGLVAIAAWLRFLSRREARFLSDFVIRTLEAGPYLDPTSR
ncbi:MAG TPA: hypothetical protein VMR50_00970 [Myxococcota bacterium]|nr:hypothetical protein [Myxococcota bacterium]